MKPSFTIVLAALLIAFLSWHWGGVTTDGRLIAIGGGIVILIAALFFTSLSSSAPLARNRLYFLPLILITSGGIVYLASPAPELGKIQFFEIISCSLLFTGLILSRPKSGSAISFYLLILLWGCFLIIYGAAQSASNFFLKGTLTGTYVNRNHFCSFIGMIAPLALSFSLGGTKKSLRWLSRIGFMILLVGIILTKSRGGLLAFGISSMVLLVIYFYGILKTPGGGGPGKIKRGLFFIGGLIVILLISLIYFHLHHFSLYSTSIDELSIRTRLSIWESTLSMFSARPITGWGWGTFSFVYLQFKEPDVWYSVPHAHNEFLQLLGEGGIVALGAIGACFAWSLIRLFNNLKSNINLNMRLFSLGAAGALIYALVHSGFDFILRIPANSYLLAALTGIALAFRKFQSVPVLTSQRSKFAFALTAGLLLFFFILNPTGKLFLADQEVRRGNKLLREDKPRDAREFFSRALQIDPGTIRALYGRARADMILFDRSPDKIRLYESIRADLGEARQINPWDTLLLLELAVFHQRLSAYEKAADNFTEALSLDPTSPYLYLARARNHLRRGNEKAAAGDLNRAAEIYVCAWPKAMKLLLSHTADYEILKDLPPPEDEFHLSLGYELMALRNWEGAEEEFRRAVQCNPEDWRNWRALGRLYFRLDDLQKSERAYGKALSLAPGDAQLYSELGDIFRNGQKGGKAIEFYLRAYQLEPHNDLYPKQAGAMLLKREGSETALRFWQDVSRNRPGWGWPYYARAVIFFNNDDIPRARQEITLALERTPKHHLYLNFKRKLDQITGFGPEVTD